MSAQNLPGTVAPPAGYRAIPLVTPTLSPGVLHLLELEGEFQEAVATGGGAAFARWFAEDAVVLSNGRAATLGRGAIALQAAWDAKEYQLTWVAQGAQTGPSNDMGFTWGHYVGRARDGNGQERVMSGRYITVWKKGADGGWKVALDASADDAPGAGECCTLPLPAAPPDQTRDQTQDRSPGPPGSPAVTPAAPRLAPPSALPSGPPSGPPSAPLSAPPSAP